MSAPAITSVASPHNRVPAVVGIAEAVAPRVDGTHRQEAIAESVQVVGMPSNVRDWVIDPVPSFSRVY